MPTRSSGASAAFNPLAGTNSRSQMVRDENVDENGWGRDAPQITRTQLEKVQSSYQPTKVNMRELSSQKQEPSRFSSSNDSTDRSDVVKGGYQPIGKVDIAALRRQAQETQSSRDDRPTTVKGSYEPIGRVDIAAIRAKAQRPEDAISPASGKASAFTDSPIRSSDREETKPIVDRSAPFASSERMTSLPKPKIANRFGANAGTFMGTKAPAPVGYGLESKLSPGSPPVGVSRTFADEGGKTPAQIWAEKKARQRGLSGASEQIPSPALGGPVSPITSQNSGGGEWKSGYAGKSWAAVQTTKTGQSATSLGEQRTGETEEEAMVATQSTAGGVGALRDRFKNAVPMGATAAGSERSAPSPPALDTSSKPSVGRGVPIPGLPTRPTQHIQEDDQGQTNIPVPPPPQSTRSPTPPTPAEEDPGSPIRVAMPVSRGEATALEDVREEQFSPPPAMPVRSLAQAVPHEEDLSEEPSGHDASRSVSQAVATESLSQGSRNAAGPETHENGHRAIAQYDYEKAEANELEMKEGEHITNIEMVDEDWWMGQNSKGETGLFPSNYVELTVHDGHMEHASELEPESEAIEEPAPSAGFGANARHQGETATAIYDYEATEDNELSFPEAAIITNVVSTFLSC